MLNDSENNFKMHHCPSDLLLIFQSRIDSFQELVREPLY